MWRKLSKSGEIYYSGQRYYSQRYNSTFDNQQQHIVHLWGIIPKIHMGQIDERKTAQTS